jgi:hypothetical protein
MKNKLSLYFIFISIFSFITIFFSIVQKSYFNLVNPVKEIESNKLLTPIDPNLNLEVIEEIKNRPENLDYGPLNFFIEEDLQTENVSTSSSENQDL